MALLAKQLRVALEVYRQRGLKAEEAFKTQDLDKAFELLHWREIAFHNFKAAEAYEAKLGYDMAKDEEILAMWQDIKASNARLEALIENQATKLRTELQAIVKARAYVARFHSGSTESQTSIENRV